MFEFLLSFFFWWTTNKRVAEDEKRVQQQQVEEDEFPEEGEVVRCYDCMGNYLGKGRYDDFERTWIVRGEECDDVEYWKRIDY